MMRRMTAAASSFHSGLQPYSSAYVSPFPHAILAKRKNTSEQSKRLAPTVMMKLYASTLVRGA